MKYFTLSFRFSSQLRDAKINDLPFPGSPPPLRLEAEIFFLGYGPYRFLSPTRHVCRLLNINQINIRPDSLFSIFKKLFKFKTRICIIEDTYRSPEFYKYRRIYLQQNIKYETFTEEYKIMSF